MEKLKWCFKIKEGIKITKPSENISKLYTGLAKTTLKRAESMLKESDLLWTTVMVYYADYYALFSFLARIGVKCENHLCSILLMGALLGSEKIEVINEHKDKRIDAQYYFKIVEKREIEAMLNSAKIFVADFEGITSNLDEKKIAFFRRKLKEFEK